jgi:hypothetical protein
MVRLGQTIDLSCVTISAISKQTETSFHLSLVTYECHGVGLKLFLRHGTFGANVHLSCTDANTISKWIET